MVHYKQLGVTLAMGLGLLLGANQAEACTNFLITKGASADGSTMITYAADSHLLYGELYFWPAAKYPKGALYKVYEWDTGKYLGEIPQVESTYSVVGNMNEHQLAIGETTYGGRHELADSTGIMDYGTLIYVALQRAKTAREAIRVITDLMREYGYASSGESFSISDPNEVWILELIGKGTKLGVDKKTKQPVNLRKGAVWVARLVPDGYVCGHANQARITTFPLANGKTSITDKQINKLNDPKVTTVYSHDVISFAREMNYFKGKDAEFSFSDTYAPVDFGAARFCEVRVWSFFRTLVPGLMDEYLDYAMGKNLTHRMPLWVKPDHKLTVHEVMDAMRDHLEDTPLDMRKDPGAGMSACPYRWRPMVWEYKGKKYVNERATATQQTGFVFVAQSRSWLPDPVGGILWFGVDDAASTVFTPMYCGLQKVHPSYAVGNGDMLTYSSTAAFWKFNKVTNYCYLRYDLMHPDLRKEQLRLENQYLEGTKEIDKKAAELYKTDPEKARQMVSDYSYQMAENTMNAWDKLYEFLLVKYIDGNVKQEKNGVFLRSKDSERIPAKPSNPDFPDWWKEEVIRATGDRFLHL